MFCRRLMVGKGVNKTLFLLAYFSVTHYSIPVLDINGHVDVQTTKYLAYEQAGSWLVFKHNFF